MKKYILSMITTAFFFSGCASWLDVKPSDRITAEVTFSTVQGFQTALNGVYIELNNSSLYGRQLTYNFTDLLAKIYAINSESKDLYKIVQENDYTTETAKYIIKSIWSKTYTMIANVNYILQYCEINRSVLDDENYALIKGEALALRGMLHFDMLRLFGPMTNKPQELAIPYYTEFNYNKNSRENFETILNHVLADFSASLGFLKIVDPIVANGLVNDNPKAFLNYRNLRLNYYAVKALEARALLYGGKVAEALIAAKEVIAVQTTYFPFTQGTVIAESNENPDRIFSSEILFGLQTMGRKEIATFFDGSSINSYYTSSESVSWFFGDVKDDVRYKSWFRDVKEYSAKTYSLFGKFDLGSKPELLLNQLYPLIRVSEMYYIAAECEPVVADGLAWLNKVKVARDAGAKSTTSKATLMTYIDLEYQVEFWGEGQLFFYQKRRNKVGSSDIRSPYQKSAFLKTTAIGYVLPLPEEESDYN